MTRANAQSSEWRTRKRLIGPKLQAAGWRVAPYDPAHPFGKTSPVAIEEFPTENGPADYALCVDGQLLGVVEIQLQNILGEFSAASRAGADQLCGSQPACDKRNRQYYTGCTGEGSTSIT